MVGARSLTLAMLQLDEYLSNRSSTTPTAISCVPRGERFSAHMTSGHPAFDLLDALYDSVQAFKQCPLDPELRLAAKELACLIWNHRHFPPRCNTIEDAIATTFAARNWVRFIPDAPKRLASQDFGAQMLIAHWETFYYLILNMASLDEHAFFLKDREMGISNLLQQFASHESRHQDISLGQPLTKIADPKQHALHERVRLKWTALAQSTLLVCRSRGPPSNLPFNTT